MATSKEKLRANLEKARAALAAKRKAQQANPNHHLVAHRTADPLARAAAQRYIQNEIRALEARIRTLQTLQKAL